MLVLLAKDIIRFVAKKPERQSMIIAPRHFLVAVALITPDSLLANATEYT